MNPGGKRGGGRGGERRPGARPHLRPGGLSPEGSARVRFESASAAGDALVAPTGEATRPEVLAFDRLARAAEAADLGLEAASLVSEVLDIQSEWIGPAQREALGLLLLASLGALRDGSTRLKLERGASSRLGRRLAELAAGGGVEQSATELLKVLHPLVRGAQFGHVVGRGDDAMPLILEGDWLYHHRMLWLERHAAARLIALGAGPHRAGPHSAGDDAITPAAVERALQDVCAHPPRRNGVGLELDADQRDAVRRAVLGPVTVISGGPGTGKTAIIVSILRVLRRVTDAPVALAAPTGKAANRMSSSVHAALAGIDADGATAAAPADTAAHAADHAAAGIGAAVTLHRLLGYQPHDDRFRHDEHNPLPAAWVLVDEASMIDLAQLERLLAALRPGTRLILLGDADQLPSIDAGAVLRDLRAAAAAGAPAVSAATLTRSYRMDPADPAGRAILSAAQAINAGDLAPLLGGDAAHPARATRRSAARFLAYQGVEWIDAAAPADLAGFVAAWYHARIAAAPFAALAARTYRLQRGAWHPEDAVELRALLAIHERSRLLAVTRGLPTGAFALNRALHQLALVGASVVGRPPFYAGEPVMMTRNDYERGLYNGDQGVIVRVVEDGGPQRFRAVFPRSGGTGAGELAPFHLDALRASLELAYAITVHKAQGAELDAIALVLPTDDVPLLTRELVYTAITRARRSVVLVGSRARLQSAAARSIERDSGLAERIVAGTLR